MTEDQLDEILSCPRPETTATLAACPGDVIILGAGGKMGPTLARMVARAANGDRRVIAVSRWSSPLAERALNDWGVDTVACDLLDRDAVARLPDAPNIIFMAGQKFGTTGAPATTWAMNTLVPANCAERYRGSRIVAFSTGNVYSLTPLGAGGSREDDVLGPVGEYAASCVGRERVFEWASERYGTPVALIRLNYAIALRYGVLSDIAMRVKSGAPVPVDMGYVNVIWQADANAIAIESLAQTRQPPFAINVTGVEQLSVRQLAAWFAARFHVPLQISGSERPDALLSNTHRMQSTFGLPAVSTEQMLEWTADWVDRGGELLGKPTKFEARDGKF